MRERALRSAWGAAVFLVLLAMGGCARSESEPPPPNIVFVMADDLGWADVNRFDPLGRSFYETPHLDALAAQGLRFLQAYANGANCAPTRAALMSGQYYPHQPIYHVGAPSQGELIPAENATHLPTSKMTIAETLKQANYVSASIGKWHIGEPPQTGPTQQGFDVNVGGYLAGNPGVWEGGYFQPNNNPYIDDARPGEYLTDYLTRKAVSFIERDRDAPFYLQLSYYTPHSPYQAPDTVVRKYQQKEGEGGHNHPTYAAMIEAMDRGVGRLMETLNRLGIAENTIFVFYSDNGGKGGYGFLGHADGNVTSNAPLKSGKGSFYEGGIRVPLVVRWPRVIDPGGVSNEPVIGIDFYPTMLEAAGIDPPPDYRLDGESLMPLFRDAEATLDRRSLYWHFPGYPNAKWRTSPVSVIRSGPWKLMMFYEDQRLELYNLKTDRGEERNLAEDRPAIRKRLHDRLTQWLDENDAPLPKRRSE